MQPSFFKRTLDYFKYDAKYCSTIYFILFMFYNRFVFLSLFPFPLVGWLMLSFHISSPLACWQNVSPDFRLSLSWEVSCQSLEGNASFFSSCFFFFISFALMFSNFTTICFSMYFFLFILLRICWTFKI